MAFVQRGLLRIESPLLECKRFRGKINIRRPRKPHFERQLFLDISEPKYPKTIDLPMKDRCSNLLTRERRVQDNPFEAILARECANWFNHSRMVAFLHMNSITAYDSFQAFRALKMENMNLRVYGKKIVKMATTGTPFEAVQQLFQCHTKIVFSEQVQPKTLLNILRKTPEFILIGGIINGRFLSRNEFVEYSNFPALDVMQSKLCNVLQSSGLTVVNQMTQHQQNLVNCLDQFVKINMEKEKEDDPPLTETSQTES